MNDEASTRDVPTQEDKMTIISWGVWGFFNFKGYDLVLYKTVSS